MDLEGVAVSAGSACASGSMRPSPVLLAMGWSESEAARGLRVSVGHAVDEDGVRRAAEILRRVLTK
jgi:cysteine desulfurase